MDELTRFGAARRLAHVPGVGGGGVHRARADRERGTLAAAAAAALRHRTRSHKLAMVVESPCGSRMHAHARTHTIKREVSHVRWQLYIYTQSRMKTSVTSQLMWHST